MAQRSHAMDTGRPPSGCAAPAVRTAYDLAGHLQSHLKRHVGAILIMAIVDPVTKGSSVERIGSTERAVAVEPLLAILRGHRPDEEI